MQCLNERSVCTYQRVFWRETTQKVMSWKPRKVRHCMFCETLMSFWDTLPSSTPSRPPTTTPSKATGRGGEIQLARTDGGHWWLTIHCHTVMVWVIRCPNGGYEGSITLSGGSSSQSGSLQIPSSLWVNPQWKSYQVHPTKSFPMTSR
jgi:hypothetical protein